MPNGQSYGDIFAVATPALDNLHNRLYAEQRQRELMNERNVQALDNEFSRNVSNIRDADVDDLTAKYNDYKLSTQKLMRQKGGIPPQQQMEVLRKKAEMYKLINESKAEREREEMAGKRYSIKPDDFNDDAAELLIAGRNLPISKKKTYTTKDGKVIDLTNPENLLWTDKTNWQPILQKAGGTLVQRGHPVEKVLSGGLESEITTVKGGNDPLEYYSSIVGAMNTPRASQSLATRYNFTPEEAQDIMIKFNELKKDPAFKNAYGDVKFPDSAMLTPGTRTAMLLSMTNALNNPPTATVTRKSNKDAVMNKQAALSLSRQKVMEAIRQGNRKEMAGIRRGWQILDQEAQNEILSNVFEGYKANPSAIPEDLLEDYKKKNSKGHKVDFTEVKVSPDGTKIQMIVTAEKGKPIPEFSSEANVSDLKERTRKKIETVQTNVVNTGTNKTPQTKTAPSYKRADLLKAGWTQEQINTAIKAGKIKVN